MKNIAITTTSFGEFDRSPLDVCKERGYNVVLNPHGRKVTTPEFIQIAQNAVGVVAGTETITDEALAQLPNLKVISRCGVGIDNVDLMAAERQKIKVFATLGAPTQAVVELTLAFMLNLLRRVQEQHEELCGGKWSKKMGNLLWKKRVGIIGFGQIGQKLAHILKAFECEISYIDPFVKSPDFEQRSLPDLLGWADIVTLHVSDSAPLIGEKELKLMQPNALLINTSRGSVIDEHALYDSLQSKKLAGAGLDVFQDEPYKGRLTQLKNVILTPHIGSYAKETRIEMERQAIENLLKGLI